MKVPPRIVSAWALAALLAACGGGGGGGGGGSTPPPASPPPATPPPTTPPPTQANRAPTAANDVLQSTGAGVANLAVLANDADPDNDALTVTITSQPFVGTAAVNANNTVRIDGLPAGFRGFTQFGYQVRDPAGATANANAVVYVDVAPFRLVMNVDEARSGASDLYLQNFLGAPVKLGNATEGALRLGGFRASRNGATVAYTRADPANAATTDELWFVKTATPTQPVRVSLPAGAQLIRVNGNPLYRVSADGRWLAFVAGSAQSGGARTLQLVDTNAGGTATAITAPGSTIAAAPEFTADSRTLYWLAAPGPSTSATVWRVAVDTPAAPVRVSREGSGTTGVLGFGLVADGSRIVVGRLENDVDTIAVIEAATPGSERVISHAPAAGEAVYGEGVLLSPDGQRVVYSVGTPQAVDSRAALYVAQLTGTAAPRRIAAPAPDVRYFAYQVRPDNAAALIGREVASSIRLVEVSLAGAAADAAVAEAGTILRGGGRGIFAGYDGTNDRVVFERSVNDPALLGVADVRTVPRSGFGATAAGTLVGSSGRVPSFTSFSAAERGVVMLSERTLQADAPAQPFAANVTAPDRLYPLSPGVFPAATPDTGVRVVLVGVP